MAVNSATSSAPTAPTNAMPVFTPAPTGIHARRAGKQGATGLDRPAGMQLTGEDRDEQPDHLVADELVDDRVVVDQDIGGHREELVHLASEFGW